MCRYPVGFLPLRESYIKNPVEYAHQEYKSKIVKYKYGSHASQYFSKSNLKKKKVIKKHQCSGIIGSGLKKGQLCSSKVKAKNGYCGKHSSQVPLNKVKTPGDNFFCQSITISSGKMCKNYKAGGKNNCWIHNNKHKATSNSKSKTKAEKDLYILLAMIG